MKVNKDKELALSLDKLKSLISYDAESGVAVWKVSLRPGWAGREAGTLCEDGYVRITIEGHRFLAHRLFWFYEHGEWPPHWIDHKDGRKENNKLANLRLATGTQNQANKRKHRGHMLKGVTKRTDRTNRPFVAQIRKDGRLHCLGHFATEQEAHQSYIDGAQKLFGQFARGE